MSETTTENMMPKPKIRHDWYQTDTNVVVTILAKNAENVKATNTENTLSLTAKLPSGNEYSLELDLAHAILPNNCSVKVLPSKIEVSLKKREGLRWSALEGTPVDNENVKPIPKEILEACTKPPKYPSSSKKHIDWNQVEKEVEKEIANDKLEGDEAVNNLFQQIYGKGSDEVRRAMNKSFMESGGTVLSTNWNEVGSGTVEKKPPEGMEWKKWQE